MGGASGFISSRDEARVKRHYLFSCKDACVRCVAFNEDLARQSLNPRIPQQFRLTKTTKNRQFEREPRGGISSVVPPVAKRLFCI